MSVVEAPDVVVTDALNVRPARARCMSGGTSSNT